MTINKICTNRIVDHNDSVLKEVFPHVREIETIIRFNNDMENYLADDEYTNWSISQFENIEEVK